MILIVLFGILSAIFATQNSIHVPIILLGYSLREVPIYLVVSGSLLIGLLLSSFVSLINSISTTFKLRGKDSKTKESKKTVDGLVKKNRELELEVATLKERNKTVSQNL